MNEQTRNIKEMQNLFDDPKFARKAWRSIGAMLAKRPAAKIPIIVDKDGNETFASQINGYSYDKLSKDLKDIGSDHSEPTELEMIMQCQFIRARFDTQAAVFIRDTIGAKPIDESKTDVQVNNPYEQLSDDELDLLAEHRKAKQLTKKE
jgi:hypothetical protein